MSTVLLVTLSCVNKRGWTCCTLWDVSTVHTGSVAGPLTFTLTFDILRLCYRVRCFNCFTHKIHIFFSNDRIHGINMYQSSFQVFVLFGLGAWSHKTNLSNLMNLFEYQTCVESVIRAKHNYYAVCNIQNSVRKLKLKWNHPSQKKRQ